jgi:hypothetical protein
VSVGERLFIQLNVTLVRRRERREGESEVERYFGSRFRRRSQSHQATMLEHSGDLEASVDLARGKLSMCLQTGTMQASCRQVGRLRLELWAAMPPGERTQHFLWCVCLLELIRNVEGLLQGGKGQLCTTELSTTVRHKRTTCRSADRRHFCTIETLQPPTGTNSAHKEGFRSRTLPTPHHSSRLCH